MTEEISGRITNVLAHEGESGICRLMADSIRVLAVYQGISWKSELIPDLLKLYQFLGRLEVLNPRLLDEALDRLQSERLVTVEERTRGSLLSPGTFTDKLIRLADLNVTVRILMRDQTFVKYTRERGKRVRERLGKGQTREEI